MNDGDTNDRERRSGLRRRNEKEFRTQVLWDFRVRHLFKRNLDTIALERFLKGAGRGRVPPRSAHTEEQHWGRSSKAECYFHSRSEGGALGSSKTGSRAGQGCDNSGRATQPPPPLSS